MSIFHRIKLRKQLKDHANRPLNIFEILSRSDKTNVVVDAYTYFTRQSNWEIDDRFNEKIRIFLLCVLFDGEVANGGISQFFANSSGDHAVETADALHAIGAFESEALLRSSFCLFPNAVVPEDRGERNDLMDQIDEAKFDEIDRRVWEGNIEKFCYMYLTENRASFETSLDS